MNKIKYQIKLCIIVIVLFFSINIIGAEKVVRYQSFDNQIFATKEECLRHERFEKKYKEILRTIDYQPHGDRAVYTLDYAIKVILTKLQEKNKSLIIIQENTNNE